MPVIWACGGFHQVQKSVLDTASISSTIIIIGLCWLVLRHITQLTESLARRFTIHQTTHVRHSVMLSRVAEDHPRIKWVRGGGDSPIVLITLFRNPNSPKNPQKPICSTAHYPENKRPLFIIRPSRFVFFYPIGHFSE